MKIKKAIATAHLSRIKCRLQHTGGTALPGIEAKRICPNILEVISQGVDTILVTGTNGKSTTVRILLEMMKGSGVECFSNREGANTDSGIITAFAINSNLWGKPKKKIAVIECDELFVEKISQIIKPKVIVVTNLVKDQIDRMESPEHVRDRLKITTDTTNAVLCLNTDDALVWSLNNSNSSQKIMTYSVLNNEVKVNDKQFPVTLNMIGDFNQYNAAAACAAMEAMGLLSESAIKAISNAKTPFGRMERININGLEVILHLIKNPTNTNLALQYLEKTDKKYRLLIGMYYKIDSEWIQDINIEKYLDVIPEVMVAGACILPLEKRFIAAGLDMKKLKRLDDIFEVLDCLNGEDKRPIFILSDYDCLFYLRSVFARKGYVRDYWKE